MAVVKAIFSNFLAFLLCIFITAFPYAGILLPVVDTQSDDVKLTVELISDTHLEEKELFRKAFLKAAICNYENAKCDIDAVVVAGDITNYADEGALTAYYDIIKETEIPFITASGNHDIGHVGDEHANVPLITRDEARQNFIDYRNDYLGTDYDVNYYSTEVNGYKFIVIGDEVNSAYNTDGHWDAITMTDEEVEFLDNELASANGEPVFVVCHYPLKGVNGEQTIWPDSGIDVESLDETPVNLFTILEKYKNVYWISGHMHAGIKADVMYDWYGLSNCEEINGVHYINLPTFGIINSFGIPLSGTGYQMEVYDDEVVFRPRNMITNKWYNNSVYSFPID